MTIPHTTPRCATAGSAPATTPPTSPAGDRARGRAGTGAATHERIPRRRPPTRRRRRPVDGGYPSLYPAHPQRGRGRRPRVTPPRLRRRRRPSPTCWRSIPRCWWRSRRKPLRRSPALPSRRSPTPACRRTHPARRNRCRTLGTALAEPAVEPDPPVTAEPVGFEPVTAGLVAPEAAAAAASSVGYAGAHAGRAPLALGLSRRPDAGGHRARGNAADSESVAGREPAAAG